MRRPPWDQPLSIRALSHPGRPGAGPPQAATTEPPSTPEPASDESAWNCLLGVLPSHSRSGIRENSDTGAIDGPNSHEFRCNPMNDRSNIRQFTANPQSASSYAPAGSSPAGLPAL